MCSAFVGTVLCNKYKLPISERPVFGFSSASLSGYWLPSIIKIWCICTSEWWYCQEHRTRTVKWECFVPGVSSVRFWMLFSNGCYDLHLNANSSELVQNSLVCLLIANVLTTFSEYTTVFISLTWSETGHLDLLFAKCEAFRFSFFRCLWLLIITWSCSIEL